MKRHNSLSILKKAPSIAIATTLLLTSTLSYGQSISQKPSSKPISFKSMDTDYFKALQSKQQLSEAFVEWTQFAPGNSGFSQWFHIHPTDPKAVYNFPDMQTSYRSLDAGKTFESIRNPDHCQEYNGVPSTVISLDFSRQDEDFGIGVSGGIVRTKDKGKSWEKIPNAPIGKMSAVAVDPTNDNIWFIGSGNFGDQKKNGSTAKSPHGKGPMNPGKLYRSTDKGVTWTLLENTGIPAKAEFGKFYINPDNTQMMFVVTTYGLYRSMNAGQSWTKIESIEKENGDNFDQVTDLAVYDDKTSHKKILYVTARTRYTLDGKGSFTSNGGIYKSEDLGDSWTNITGNLGINYNDLNEATLNTGIEKETYDEFGGAQFVQEMFSMAKFSIGGRYFGLTDEEIAKKLPHIPNEKLLQAYDHIVVDPTNPNRLYISHNAKHTPSPYIGDVWMTEDGGKTWTIALRTGKGWNASKDYWQSIGQPTTINTTFSQEGSTFFNEVYTNQGMRDLDIASDGTIYAMYRSLLKSTDHGKTWQQTDVTYRPDGSMTGTGGSNLPGTSILTDPRDKDLLFLSSGENRLFRVTDKGTSSPDSKVYIENYYHSPDSPASIAISPDNINEMYMTVMRQFGKGDFFKSTDQGKTWNSIASVYRTENSNSKSCVPSLLIDPKDSKTMYFSVSTVFVNETSGKVDPEMEHRGVWKTTDGGYTWGHTEYNDGFPKNVAPHVLAFDPNDSHTLFAGLTVGLPAPIKNPDFSTADAWKITTSSKDATLDQRTNNRMMLHTQDASFEQTVTVQPNTEYCFSSLVNAPKGTTGELRVYDESNKLLGEVSFTNIMDNTTSVVFHTSKNQKLVKIMGMKKSGPDPITFDNALLTPTGGLYISHDKADTWSKVNTVPKEITEVNKIVFDKTGKMYIAAGSQASEATRGGIWMSEDKGLTWQKIFEMPRVNSIAIDPNNPNRLMALVRVTTSVISPTNSGIYLSEDAGNSWHKINQGLVNSSKGFDLAFDPADENILWFTSSAGGFYKGVINRSNLVRYYTVLRGETTYADIAQKLLGDPKRAQEISSLNPTITQLTPGTQLVVKVSK